MSNILYPTYELRFVKRKAYTGGDMGHPEYRNILQQYWSRAGMPHRIDGVELGEWRDVPLLDESSSALGSHE